MATRRGVSGASKTIISALEPRKERSDGNAQSRERRKQEHEKRWPRTPPGFRSGGG